MIGIANPKIQEIRKKISEAAQAPGPRVAWKLESVNESTEEPCFPEQFLDEIGDRFVDDFRRRLDLAGDPELPAMLENLTLFVLLRSYIVEGAGKISPLNNQWLHELVVDLAVRVLPVDRLQPDEGA